MAEASPWPFPGAGAGEQVPEDDEPRMGGGAPRFESDVGTRSGPTSNVGPAILRPRGPLFARYVVSCDNYCIGFGCHSPFRYFCFTTASLRFHARFKNHARGLSSPAVNINRKPFGAENPIFCAVNARMDRFFRNWRVNPDMPPIPGADELPMPPRTAACFLPRLRKARPNPVAAARNPPPGCAGAGGSMLRRIRFLGRTQTGIPLHPGDGHRAGPHRNGSRGRGPISGPCGNKPVRE